MRVSDRLKRLKWCRERLHWSVEDWAKVIFSDKSSFEVINRKSRLIIKRLAGEKIKERFCVPRIQGGGGSVRIWGCFSHKGTESTFITAELTSTTKRPSKVNFCQQPELFTEDDNNGYFSTMHSGSDIEKAGQNMKTLNDLPEISWKICFEVTN